MTQGWISTFPSVNFRINADQKAAIFKEAYLSHQLLLETDALYLIQLLLETDVYDPKGIPHQLLVETDVSDPQ